MKYHEEPKPIFHWVNSPAKAVLVAMAIGAFLQRNLFMLYLDYIGKERTARWIIDGWVDSHTTAPIHIIMSFICVVVAWQLIKRGSKPKNNRIKNHTLLPKVDDSGRQNTDCRPGVIPDSLQFLESLEKTPWDAAHRESHDGMWSTQVFDCEGETICDLAWYSVEIEDGTVVNSLRDEHAVLFKATPYILGVLGESIGYLESDEKHSICSTSPLYAKMKAAFQCATNFQRTRLVRKGER